MYEKVWSSHCDENPFFSQYESVLKGSEIYGIERTLGTSSTAGQWGWGQRKSPDRSWEKVRSTSVSEK